MNRRLFLTSGLVFISDIFSFKSIAKGIPRKIHYGKITPIKRISNQSLLDFTKHKDIPSAKKISKEEMGVEKEEIIHLREYQINDTKKDDVFFKIDAFNKFSSFNIKGEILKPKSKEWIVLDNIIKTGGKIEITIGKDLSHNAKNIEHFYLDSATGKIKKKKRRCKKKCCIMSITFENKCQNQSLLQRPIRCLFNDEKNWTLEKILQIIIKFIGAIKIECFNDVKDYIESKLEEKSKERIEQTIDRQ